MKTPPISVVVPVFNVEEYLPECLESLAGQTFREIEIICVDDGSSDASGQICDAYAARDSRFRVLHQANSGPSASRNRGMDLARGEYLIFVDSDDWVEPEMCEKAYAQIRRTGADMVQFFFDEFGAQQGMPRKFRTLPLKRCETNFEKIRCVNAAMCVVWARIYRLAFLREKNVRFLEEIIFEDTYFSMKAALLADSIEILPEILVHYRVGSGYSSSLDPKYYPKRIDYFRCLMVTISDLAQVGISRELRLYLQNMKCNAMQAVYLNYCPPEEKAALREEILASLTPEDWQNLWHPNRYFRPRTCEFFFRLNRRPVMALLVRVLGTIPRRADRIWCGIQLFFRPDSEYYF